jgi:hypothetical protein
MPPPTNPDRVLGTCTDPRLSGRRLQTDTVSAGKAVQRLAEGVERQGLDMVFDVGRLMVWRGAA